MNRTYSFVTLLTVVAISIVFGMILGGKLNAPKIVYAAPQAHQPLPIPAAPVAPAAVERGSLDFADIAEMALPAVVGITNSNLRGPDERPEVPDDLFHRYRWFFGPQEPEGEQEREPREVQSFGSGFFISSDGLILTNNHVVAESDRLLVTLGDGTRFDAEVIGTDPRIDLAVLKIEVDGREFPHLELGDSGALRVGEWVMAIGNPFEFDQTVTVGVVSAKGRRPNLDGTDAGVAVFIQTDAAINLGNSGGPLLDSQGRVVGINTAINRGGGAEGIGFALQIDEARWSMEQLLTTGEVQRGFIGIQMSQTGVDREVQEYYGLPDTNGVLVEQVTEGFPADKAGIRAGDIIRKIEGETIRGNTDLLRIISMRKPGDKVDLEVFRGGKTFRMTAELISRTDAALRAGRPPAPEEREEEGSRGGSGTATGLGLTVETYDPRSLPRQMREEADPELQGVVVSDIEYGAQAADKGIVEYLVVVVAVDDKPVHGIEDWRSAMAALEPGSTVKLELYRYDGQPWVNRFVFLRVPNE